MDEKRKEVWAQIAYRYQEADGCVGIEDFGFDGANAEETIEEIHSRCRVGEWLTGHGAYLVAKVEEAVKEIDTLV